MKLSEKIQEALREQQEINLSDPAVQKRLAAQWGYVPAGAQPAPSVPAGWKEAAIAWEVCASIHREYGKGKDPFFNTRQGDFVKHANDARAMLAAAPEANQ